MAEQLLLPVPAMYAELFNAWELPVAALFGQMVLPPAASTFWRNSPKTSGHEVLFERLRKLADDVIAIGENHSAAIQLAHTWTDQRLADPLPDDVVSVLHCVQPLLVHDPVITQGFRAWAGAITLATAHFIDEMPGRPPATEWRRSALSCCRRHGPSADRILTCDHRSYPCVKYTTGGFAVESHRAGSQRGGYCESESSRETEPRAVIFAVSRPWRLSRSRIAFAGCPAATRTGGIERRS